MGMLRLSFQYMMVRRIRAILTILAIVFGVAVLFASNNFIGSIVSVVEMGSHLPARADLRLIRMDGAKFQMDDISPTVMAIDGVVSVSGIFQHSFNIEITGEETSPPVITLLGIDPINAQTMSTYTLTAGRFFEADDTNKMILPASIAQITDMKVDDRFPLPTPSGVRLYQVIGILDDSQLPLTQLIVPLVDTQTIFEASEQVTGLDIAINGDENQISAQIIESLGEAFQIEATPVTDHSLAIISFNFFGMIALFLGAFLIYNTYQVVVIERQHDLAMLRAIGADRQQVRQVILFESLIQGVIGSIGGLIIGAVFSFWLVAWVESSGWTTGVGNLQAQINPIVAFICACIGIGIALIAGYLPAHSASKVSPLAALRPISNTPETTSRFRLVCGTIGVILAIALLLSDTGSLILGGFILLISTVMLTVALIPPMSKALHPILQIFFPIVSNLAQANILRQPKRASVIVNAVIVGFAVFVASATIVINLSGFFTNLYQDNFMSDILIFPLGGETVVFTGTALGVDASLADKLTGMDGVSAVSRLRSTRTTYEGEMIQVLGIDPEYAGILRPYRIYEGDAKTAVTDMAQTRTIYINDTLSKQFNLSLGDSLTLSTSNNSLQTYQIVAIGDDIDLSPAVPGILIANQWLETDFGITHNVTLYVDVGQTANLTLVMESIQTVLQDYPQMMSIDLSSFRETSIQRGNMISSFFYIMAILVVIPSLIGLLNTVIMNVIERRREIGMLRAIGSNQAQVKRIFLVEMLYLSSMGIILGSIVGIVLGMGMVQMWDTALMVRSALAGTIPVIEIVVGILIGIGLILFLTVIPARHASQGNIVQVLQYE